MCLFVQDLKMFFNLNQVNCIYNDHNVYVWDVHDLKKIGKQWASRCHSFHIWGVEMYFKCWIVSEKCTPPLVPKLGHKLPRFRAVYLFFNFNQVTCIYNDHSVYVWDVHDLKKIGKHWSFLYHSSCIWGVEMYPKMLDGIREMLPSESFITCSSDDTIRIWNTDPAMTSDVFKRNIYSKVSCSANEKRINVVMNSFKAAQH